MFRKRRLYTGQSFGHPHRVRDWVRAHKKIVIPSAVALVLLIGAGGVVAYKLMHKKPQSAPVAKKVEKKSPPPPAPVKYYSKLSGQEVSKADSERPITAIMIENSPDARPQSGLMNAGVVFEAIAEGGITRFLALYQEGKPQNIGPVRSLRMYYVDWLAAFDPSVVHVGGSAKALQTVRGGGFRDLDQFFNPGYFWRATDRYAPHNVYTSFAKLDELNKKKGYTRSNFTSFERKPEAPPTNPNATKIQVKISSALYNSTYTYDKPTNSYLRSHQATGNHIDRNENQQLHPKVVVVMKVNERTVLEDGYRQDIQAIGDGEAWVFQDGTVTHGKWHKGGQKAQITFKNDAGKPLKFNSGQTWITAIPQHQSVSWQP